MTQSIEYILKVAVGYALLGLFYLVFFRKDTFFKRNRIYLLLSLLLPPLLPLLTIPIILPWDALVAPVAKDQNVNLLVLENFTMENLQPATKSFDYQEFLIWCYKAGIVVMLGRVLWSYHTVYRLVCKAEKTRLEKIILAFTQKDVAPFSIFKWLVVSRKQQFEGEFEKILRHEAIHCRQRHSFDLLLAELVVVFQWFNPFVWWFKFAIAKNHEYLVDQVILEEGMDLRSYQYALLKQAQSSSHLMPVNHFNQSMIKNRIQMMNKKPSSKRLRMKEFLVLPLMLGMLIALASFEAPLSEGPVASESMVMENFTLQDTLSDQGEAKANDLRWNKSKPPLFYLDGRIVSGEEVRLLDPKQIHHVDQYSYPHKELVKQYPDALNGVWKIGTRKSPKSNVETKRELRSKSRSKSRIQDTTLTSAFYRFDELKPSGKEFVSSGNCKFSFSPSSEKKGIEKIETSSGGNEIRFITSQQEGGYLLKVNAKPIGERPLYIIDGNPAKSSSLNKIDPKTIENVSVLKGKAATDAYGMKGKNGVVQIFLKKTSATQKREVE